MIDRAATPNRDYALGLARAFAGAILFGLPLLMTMEMWTIGYSARPGRLLAFLIANFAVLVVLSRFGGFERTSTLVEDVLDALAAYAVGIFAAALILTLFGLIGPELSPSQAIRMIAVQSVPASFGAMIARKQLSGDEEEEGDKDQDARSAGYAGQLFLMLAGALFLAFNVAPTEEILLIGYKMSAWHGIALLAFSLLLLHALVFAIGFTGQEEAPEGYGAWRLFLAFTLPGYAIALIASFYVLWTFGSLDGLSPEAVVGALVVLGFPASVGAAIARLVV